MKQTKIEIQITKNLGNYESVRLGGEWSLDEGEDQQAAYKAAIEELNAIYAAQYLHEKPTESAQAVAVDDNRKHVTFKTDAALLQSIVTRIKDKPEVTREIVYGYYSFDDEAARIIDFAFKLRGDGKR